MDGFALPSLTTSPPPPPYFFEFILDYFFPGFWINLPSGDRIIKHVIFLRIPTASSVFLSLFSTSLESDDGAPLPRAKWGLGRNPVLVPVSV